MKLPEARDSNRKNSLLHLLPYLSRYRARMVIGFAMVICTVLAGMAAPWVLKFVIDDLQSAFSRDRIPVYAAWIIGIAATEGFFRFWMRRILIGVSRDIEYEMRKDLLAHLQRVSLSFFQARSTGDIMSRATNDMNAVRMVLGPGIMYSASTVVTVIIATAILLRINWQLTILAYIPLALASFTVKRVGQQVHDRFESIQEQFSTISSKAQENLAGIRVVKAFARESSEIAEFSRLNLEYIRRSVSLIRLWGFYYPLMSALIGLSSVALIWWGGRQVVFGRLSMGEFVAFMGYLALLTWPTIATGWVINIFQRGSASMDRLLHLLEQKPDILDHSDARAPQRIGGDIEIRDLSFSYPGTDRAVLRDINLHLPAGQTLAVVGLTGSGKSTLVNLIPRLFDPPPGCVRIDGVDVREWPLADLRRSIGCVPQETFLFSDTIRENIIFGREGSVDDAEVAWAAETARVARDIQGFPQQYQTAVGERGITLSGGQKQRVAISRALMTNPRILILDDALSSVDTDTEEQILQGLGRVTRERTTIIVSHRISTVQNADQIIVLRNGEIVERGRHDELLALDGAYADLHRRQLLEEELETA